MKRNFLLILFSVVTVGALAQKPLSNSRTSGFYMYIYPLDDAAVRLFYSNKPQLINDQILRLPVDSFPADKPKALHLPAGNYLRVTAVENRLQYQLIEQRTAWFKLLDNHRDLQFVLLDSAHHEITDASVYSGNQQIMYDAEARLYHTRKTKKDTLLRISYRGVSNFYKVKEQVYRPYQRKDGPGWLAKLWLKITSPIRNLFKKEQPNRYAGPKTNPGYIVFNKPKYRPGDTVKLKAFVVSTGSKKPIGDSKVIVRLKDDRWGDGKIIGYATSYRKGGYEYRFKLTDSMDLRLDRDYYISLESLSSKKYNLDDYDGDNEEAYLAKRKVYQQGMFRYEDYELTTNKFTVRADKTEHSPGQPVSLYFRATDDNGLDVPDGRVEVVLQAQNAYNFKGAHVFVPDTLWKHTMPLEQLGETKLTLPDSVFPNASVSYTARVTLLNSNNERREQTKYLTYINQPGKIFNKLDADTLKLNYQVLGREQKAVATLYTLGDHNDTLSKAGINLPARLIIDPAVSTYIVKADSVSTTINTSQFNAGINASGYRTADSLYINVTNPHRAKLWYTIFASNRVLERGWGTTLNYAKSFPHRESVSVLINYLWAGRTQYQEIRVPYQDKYLSIEVKQPVTVFPGQQADITINIKDDKGRPVQGADVTAYAITSKFENYSLPNIPYLGKIYPDRKYGNALNVLQPGSNGSLKLNWLRWSRQMGLNSIEYYKFTHPLTVYQQAEANPDDSTQIAPFVMKNGDIIPVHILYIDDVPVYFSKTSDVQQYSFNVKPGLHTLRFRTANQNIQLRDVNVPLHKKLILSLNADTLKNKVARFKAMADTLTNYEADLISKYLIGIVPNYGDRMVTVKQDNRIFLLNGENRGYAYYNRSGQSNLLTIGPVNGNLATFKPKGGETWYFTPENGYSYQFEPGLIRQKSLPTRYSFDKNLSVFNRLLPDYKQYALTQTAVDTLWQNYLDLRSNTTELFPVNYNYDRNHGELNIAVGKLSNGSNPFVKNVIVYKNNDPDFMSIFPGNRTYLGRFAPGRYRILYLLKGNAYFLQEDVMIKPHGKNFYSTGIIKPHGVDSISRKIAGIIDNYQRYSGNDAQVVQQIKETFNNKYLDVSQLNGEMDGYVYAQDDKMPLPGVTIKIKGTSTGTNTDRNGYFRIKVPENGKLVISYIGYIAEEAPIHKGQRIKLYLKPANLSLQEVVVVGYGTQMKSNLTGSVSSLSTALNGKLAGVNIAIRGNNSIAGGSVPKPVVVVDGVIVSFDMSTVDPALIADIQVLNGSSATALYGANAAAGAVVITTKKAAGKGLATDLAQAQPQVMRKNFSDYAYWQPKLITDEQGNATFKTTFPDDITNWRTVVASITANRQSGVAEGSIKAYKPLSANFTTPLFAIRGDVLKPIGKVLNYTTDTVKLHRAFKYNGELQGEKDITIKNSAIDTFTVTATGKDSLSFEYIVKRANGYFDGEKRNIPLFEQGTLETKGIFAALDKDTTLSIQLDPKLKEGTFRAEASVLPSLLDETRHLRDYEYLCNEQLASKLKGLLAEKKIKMYLNEPFKYDKNITEIIKKLQENRRAQGTWGWWKDTDEELWISLHAAEALLEAEAQGFKTLLDKQRLIDYLLYQSAAYKGEDKLTVMLLLKKLGAKADYAGIITAYQKELNPKYKPSLYDKLRLMLVKQQNGQPFQQDSLMKWMHQTMFGNVYWGNANYSFFSNSIHESLLAYQLLKTEGKHPDLLAKLRNYFLEQRRDGYWRNTYESAQILETILPDLLIAGKKPEPSILTISGNKNETVTKFPYTTTLSGDAALTVKKTGTMPVLRPRHRSCGPFWLHVLPGFRWLISRGSGYLPL
jgi:TonB-dependent SusC/RagA subfamily outer membrane receptor